MECCCGWLCFLTSFWWLLPKEILVNLLVLNLLLPHPFLLLLPLIFVVICHRMIIQYILICLAIIFLLTLTSNIVFIVSVRLDCLSLSSLVCLAFSNLGSESYFALVALKLWTPSFLSFSPTLLILTLPLFHLEYLIGLWYNISLDVVAAASRIPRVSNPTFPFDCNSAPNCGIMLSCFCDRPMEWGPHDFVGTNHFSAESR